jgi:beta-glucanase (GH16 family)
MKSFALSAIAALAALLPTALAQTHTNCNPLNTTGCPSMQALGTNATFLFNKTGIPTNDKVWTKQNNGKVTWDVKGGTVFTIERSGDSPMVQSKFYMLFGRLEVLMRAGSGKGIVSSAILQSEALDEIDWEFLGSNTTHVLTNYFGKGNTSAFDRGKEYPIASAPQDDFHNYTIDWTKDRIQWWLDGNMLRELLPAQALDGKNYPQTPMNVRLGMWAGGDVKNNDPGVVAWAGGETNFKDGPFQMQVQQVYVQDYTEAKEYSWDGMDASGSWEKVKVIK